MARGAQIERFPPENGGKGRKEEDGASLATENAFIGLCIATRSHYKRLAPVKAITGSKTA